MDNDFEGAPWPPTDALAAKVGSWHPSSRLRDALVELGPLESGFFLCLIVEGRDPTAVGQTFFFYQHELIPQTRACEDYIMGVMVGDLRVHEEKVYDLRDALDRLGIACTADAVARWTGEQFNRVLGWTTCPLLADLPAVLR